MKYFFMGISVIVLVWAGTFADDLVKNQQSKKQEPMAPFFYVMMTRDVR